MTQPTPLPAPLLYCPIPLTIGTTVELPERAAKHAQVLRLQPTNHITLFQGGLVTTNNGELLKGCYQATITQMGRKTVHAHIDAQHPSTPAQAKPQVHIACCVPTNERMDWLVEKATELGAHSIQPLLSARSVLRLSGARATKRIAHWQNIAIAACEQSKRLRIPPIGSLCTLSNWLNNHSNTPPAKPHTQHWILSLNPTAQTLAQRMAATNHSTTNIYLLSGAEGGFTPKEEAHATQQGFIPITLGQHTLRAETAPLAALAGISALQAKAI